jgi:hypothetical protein
MAEHPSTEGDKIDPDRWNGIEPDVGDNQPPAP